MRKGVDPHAAPPADQIMPELVEEHDRAEDHDERQDVPTEPGQEIRNRVQKRHRPSPRASDAPSPADGRAVFAEMFSRPRRSGQESARSLARDMVNGERLRNAPRRRQVRRPRAIARDRPLDQAGDVAEADPSVEEGRDRDFVGGVERGRRAAARAQRVDRDAERRKALEVRALEGQTAERGEIGRPDARGDAVRIGEAMGDRACACRATPCRRSASRRRRR